MWNRGLTFTERDWSRWFGAIEVHKKQQETDHYCNSPSPQRRTSWSWQRIRCLAVLPTGLLPGMLFLRLRLWARVGTAVEGRYSAALGVGVQAAVWRGVVGLQLCGPLDFLQCPYWKLKREDDTLFILYAWNYMVYEAQWNYNSQDDLDRHDQMTKVRSNATTPTLLLQQSVLPLQVVDVLLVCVVFPSHILDILCGFV